MQLVIFLPTFNVSCMRLKIRCDGWKRKYFRYAWQVNAAKKKVSLLKPTLLQKRQVMPPIKKTSEYNQHPNVATPACVGRHGNVGFAPGPFATAISMQAVKAAPKHRAASAPMPCHAKAGQRSPRAAQRSACTVPPCTHHTPLSLWLTHAHRKRTDDDDSPPWLYPTGHSDARRPERAKSSRWRPDTAGSSPKGVHGRTRPRDGVRSQSQQKENWGEIKRRFSVWSVLSSIKGGRTARRA
jgi:hypothetical protein